MFTDSDPDFQHNLHGNLRQPPGQDLSADQLPARQSGEAKLRGQIQQGTMSNEVQRMMRVLDSDLAITLTILI